MSLTSVDEWYRFFREDTILEFLPDRFDSPADMRETIEWLISNYSMPMSRIVRITLGVHERDLPEIPRGFVSFGPLPEDAAKRELAYAIHPAFTGQGYATEACRAFLEWIGEVFAVSPIYASIHRRNVSSLRVAEKLGFKPLSGAGDPLTDAQSAHLILERYGPT
jgi:RimJ/RimL family protein N-acetyltransferase